MICNSAIISPHVSYHELHTSLLKQSKVDMSKLVDERMWNSIHKCGTNICPNGWDNFIKYLIVEHDVCLS
jgi:hypothetical protein